VIRRGGAGAVLLVGTLLLTGCTGPILRPRNHDTTTATTASTFDTFTFQHPSSWRSYPPEGLYLGTSHAVGYLSDQELTQQCDAQSINCDPLLTELKSGAVFVAIDEVDLVSVPFGANATLAGLPATVTHLAPDYCGVAGATYAVRAIIAFSDTAESPARNLELYIAICANNPAARTESEINAMLSTLTH
jgi:hypothetical protein